MLDITPYLRLMVEKKASDLFLSTEARVQIKIDGTIRSIGERHLPLGSVKELAYHLMSEKQTQQFEKELEMNFALSSKEFSQARFRVNVYRQRGEVAMVIRMIPTEIPTIEELHLPEVLKDMVMRRSGLVLLAGATGAGKSTSLAAMIEYRNQRSPGHILTIEDPIEYLHTNRRSLINQREVGIDTLSFESALRNGLREAPDVILIGEIRDRHTMEQAIRYSETGHLCISTLHSNNAAQAISHINNFFQESEWNKISQDLAHNLQAIICQRLVRNLDGALFPATEVLINTPYVAELISRGETSRVREALESSSDVSSHSIDECLLELYSDGIIGVDEVIKHADSRNNVTLKLKLMGAEI